MSLLLTCYVDQYCIDLCGSLGSLRRQCRGAAFSEPLADQLPVKPITLDDEHTLHGRPPP